MTRAVRGHRALFAAKPTLTAFWLLIQAVKRVILAARVGPSGCRSGSHSTGARGSARRRWRARARWATPDLLPARLGLGSARSGHPGLGSAVFVAARPGRLRRRLGSLDIEALAASSEAAAPLGDIASLPRVSSSGSPQSPSAASRFLLAKSAVAPTASSFSTATTPHKREPHSSPQCAICASPRSALARTACAESSLPPRAFAAAGCTAALPSAASLNVACAPSRTSRKVEIRTSCARDGRAAVTSGPTHPPDQGAGTEHRAAHGPPRAAAPRGARWIGLERLRSSPVSQLVVPMSPPATGRTEPRASAPLDAGNPKADASPLAPDLRRYTDAPRARGRGGRWRVRRGRGLLYRSTAGGS